MISECSHGYPDTLQGLHQPNQLYSEIVDTSSNGGTRGSEMQLRSFLSSLSMLKEKVNQVQSYANMFVPQPNLHANHESSSSMAIATMGTMIQEIIVITSSMMLNCQQMTLGSPNELNHNHPQHHHHHMVGIENKFENNVDQTFFDGEGLYNWYANNSTSATTTTTTAVTTAITTTTDKKGISKNKTKSLEDSLTKEAYDIIEIDANDLLAKYTHYCQVCGKGFKRDANLRMHMRAHGDEYKSSEALTNPMKKINGESSTNSSIKLPRKYSCPHEGCRWNKKHLKFQPLKSIICVKNHYKRSHCPKMYVCKRCNRKQFSVLSDLRTHEKHCGDLKWQCSCGTTFSRKDKLMGHLTLFVGHSPMVSHHQHHLGSLDNKLDNHFGTQIQFEDS
ncbi:hypothetical protein RND81_14G010700 [Saponaria officinalis]|uniref:C2H2-type domain-containing protein n=1 Tax=Saponaria officinalis TaxID=3572 RepID=A0AAW1GH11_SAPOF